MKRFWLLVLLMAGSLVSLYTPAFAADDDSTEDINQALGSIKSQVNDLSKSIAGIGLYGDVRLKYSWATQSSGTSGDVIADQDKYQIRARLGVKKTFGDVVANVRLVTSSTKTLNGGDGNYPASQTPNLGAGLSDPVAYFDTASLIWTPSFLDKHVQIGGGKIANPLDYSPITWDETLTLDAAYVALQTGDKDNNTKLISQYVDYGNPNAAGNGDFTTAVVGGNYSAAQVLAGYTNNVDSYIWTTQLSQDLKLDQDSKLHFMVGYEYIPYVTQIANDFSMNGNSIIGDGMIQSYGPANYIPDIAMGEFMAQYSGKLFADVPWKWTLHITDNFDSFNVPSAYLTNVTPGQSNAAGYSSQSNQLGGWLSVDLGASATNPAKDAFGSQLAIAYVEPNAQLSYLTDHDGNFTNTEYFRGIFSFGLENNIALQWKTWVLYHVYYDSSIQDVGASQTSLGKASQTGEWQNFFYATASF
jgi:hypothetical protein